MDKIFSGPLLDKILEVALRQLLIESCWRLFDDGPVKRQWAKQILKRAVNVHRQLLIWTNCINESFTPLPF